MLGEKIKELRKHKDITQLQLSKEIGVSTSMVGMYETNARKPSYEVLTKIADYFNVSTDYLLGETGNQTTDKSIKEDLPLIPKEFTNPDEARQYVNKHQIFGSNGFDSNKLDNDEILEFANELLKQMELISFKFKK